MRSSIAILLLLTAFALSGCKRDYPSDTPKWLKERITSIKRSQNHGCPQGFATRIEEYTETTTKAKLYGFRNVEYDGGLIFYDKDGNELCSIDDPYDCSPYNGCACGVFNTNHIDFTRLIWSAKHCY